MGMKEQLLSNTKLREEIMSDVLITKEEQDAKLSVLKKEASDLAAKIDAVAFSNRWTELVALREQAKNQLRRLKKRAQEADYDKFKVLEARQDITMWIAQGHPCNKLIDLDIRNLDAVRIQAWLSIDQNNIGKDQTFAKEPLVTALSEAMFPDDWGACSNELTQCERAVEQYRKLSSELTRSKELLLESQLKAQVLRA
ncbi:hypothetical protein C1S86_00695 [Vibrio parahaemolyticus]|nr:hypothetical protein BSR61_11720 [Vibrio parahaemolyticus]PMT78424.1 hypothetical protein C1S97_03150 [Vibrio parahaemolyticus]PMT83501.1 hypothetical protein C1S86_00695 [Vibrio parahaemolyticus]